MIVLRNGCISICKEIASSPAIAWDILTDTHLWPIWGSSLADVDCPDRYIEFGSRGSVKALFFWFPFQVIAFREQQYWNWRVGPIEATGHTLIKTGENTCRLCFDMPWWAAPYVLVCSRALSNIAKIASAREKCS